MKIGKSHRLLYASLAAPVGTGGSHYADEFGRRHPKGYLLIDHTGIQWRLPRGRIRTIQLTRTAAPARRQRRERSA